MNRIAPGAGGAPAAAPRVPVIVGPTGIGKSRVALALAGTLDGEIVVADSRQVYRHLHIATNHPGPEERRSVPFHLVEVAEPDTAFNVHDFVRLATAALADIVARGRLAIVEGGSVLYVDVLCDGFSLGGVPPRPDRRRELASLPLPQLAALLDRLDPAAVVDRRNPVRLVRAIELLEGAGPPLERLRSRRPPAFEAIRVGLRASLEAIDRRLLERSLRQVERGLVEETRRALESGVTAQSQVLTGIGYREAVAVIRGELTASELPLEMARANRRYARRQLSWLRRDPRITWFDVEADPVPSILTYLGGQLK